MSDQAETENLVFLSLLDESLQAGPKIVFQIL